LAADARGGESLRQLIAGRQTAAFLKDHLRPVLAPDARLVARLILDLESTDFAVREQAVKDLEKLGEVAVPALRKALADQPPLETRRRIEPILAREPAVDLRSLRAIEVLEHIGSREAREILRALAGGAPGARLTEEARASLKRLQSGP
jgi:hypothetical protein